MKTNLKPATPAYTHSALECFRDLCEDMPRRDISETKAPQRELNDHDTPSKQRREASVYDAVAGTYPTFLYLYLPTDSSQVVLPLRASCRPTQPPPSTETQPPTACFQSHQKRLYSAGKVVTSMRRTIHTGLIGN